MKVYHIILMLVIFLVVVWVIGFYGMEKKESKAEVYNIDKNLTDWVYEHSTKASRKMAESIVKWSMKSDKSLLVLAICSVESEFNTTAESSAGAIGLGQIMWKVWESDLKKAGIAKERRDLFDEETNIKATIYILNECLKQSKGDITAALTRYLGTNNSYYKNRITEACTNLYIKVGNKPQQLEERLDGRK